MLNESHKSLKGDYEVTGLELDTICETLKQSSIVLGARMTGAGFGGCAIALVSGNNQLEIDKLFTDLSVIYKEKTGLTLSYYEASPSVITKL